MTVDNIAALRARDDLLAVAASWGSLRARLVPSNAAGDGVHTAPGSRPPIVVPVSDLIRQITDRTRFYANKLHADAKDWTPATSLMPGLLVEVATRHGHFVARSSDRMALDFVDDAHEMRRLVTAAIEGYAAPRWAGPCPAAPTCPGQIYQRAESIDAECRECGQLVGAQEWRALMFDAMESRLMSLSEITSALVVTGHNVPEETVKTWAKRGAQHGDPVRGLVPVYVEPTLFKFADAYALAERRSQRSSA